MAKVIDLPVATTLDLDPDRTLESLMGKLDGFVYAGYDKDGHEVVGSTFGDKREILWLLEVFRQELMAQD